MSSLIQGYQIAVPLLLSGSGGNEGTLLFSGSYLEISGYVSASEFRGLVNTASFAETAVTSSYPISTTGNTLYSTAPKAGNGFINPDHSIFFGFEAGDGALSGVHSIFMGYRAGYGAQNSIYANFLGENAGFSASDASYSTFIGEKAGEYATNAYQSIFIGNGAGKLANEAYLSNFLGPAAGREAVSASNSNFFGELAGFRATNADNSHFLGYQTGYSASNASHSIFIGYQTGKNITGSGVGGNNIILGTNLTLENDRRDSINIGAIIFATGSHFSEFVEPYSGSVMGKVGINKSLPLYNFDVSGSGNFDNNLTVTGSLTITGSSTFYGDQTISGSSVSVLDLHGINDSLWWLRLFNDAYNPTQSVFASWIDNSGTTLIGNEVDTPIYVYSNAQYYNPILIISSSGVTVGAGGITGSLYGTASWAENVTGLNLFQISTGSVTASVDVGPNGIFLIQSSSQTYIEISSSSDTNIYSDLFIIKNFTTKQPVFTVSQSIVQFATQSSDPVGSTQAGSIWFTSANMYVGLE